MTPSQHRALAYLAGVEYGIPSEIGYAIAEDRSKRSSGMIPQGAGRLGGTVATQLVKLGLAEHCSRLRSGFSAYKINQAGREALLAEMTETG